MTTGLGGMMTLGSTRRHATFISEVALFQPRFAAQEDLWRSRENTIYNSRRGFQQSSNNAVAAAS